jgi:hypothetical protein
MVLQKSVRVNEKSGGFLGVPWYIPWYIPWNIPWYIPSCQRALRGVTAKMGWNDGANRDRATYRVK